MEVEPFSPVHGNARTFHLTSWCDEEHIDLVIVGPEAPLAAGIADALSTDRRMVFGPGAAGARLEADKAWAKQVMRQAAVPTAEARVFKRIEEAEAWIDTHDGPCVIKASGLAAGKGVIVCDEQAEARDAIQRIMAEREFGDAGDTILIEDRLIGQEVSILALVDGHTIWLLDPAQDHKQVGEGDTGPNTGGMGAYCPTPLLDSSDLDRIEGEILVPLVDGLRRNGVDYHGVLYAGLMLTPAGPKVLEFNCRFGDPECQPLMTRLQGDLVDICWATAAGSLDSVSMSFDPRVACCVVLCSEGYPGSCSTGHVITGIEDAERLGGADESVQVFHAGTTCRDGDLVTSGGRVLGVTALSSTLSSARDLANEACGKITFDGSFHRHDIGDRVLIPAGTAAHQPDES